LTLGATDGRYYHALTDNVYRFTPMHLRPEDLARIHGVNERIAEVDFTSGINFYGSLIVNSQTMAVGNGPHDEL